MFYSIMSELGR